MPELSKTNKGYNVRVVKDGPYLVSGSVPLFHMIIQCGSNGIPEKWVVGERLNASESYGLCRCGHTGNKPFCDGAHVKVNFEGKETSDNEPFEVMAKVIDGPELRLKDAEILCASARFCHRGGDIWVNVPKSDDPAAKHNAIDDACDCPSGRLVVSDKKNGLTIEPILEKSIGVIEDPSKNVDGPLWVRGGIPVYSANGKLYEIRNRVTLCRCGKSTNKPFCDSSHYPEEEREVP